MERDRGGIWRWSLLDRLMVAGIAAGGLYLVLAHLTPLSDQVAVVAAAAVGGFCLGVCVRLPGGIRVGPVRVSWGWWRW